MKIALAFILSILLICSVCACSSLFGEANTGVQNEGTSLDNIAQDASNDGIQASSGDASPNSRPLADEQASSIKHVIAVLFFATPGNNALKQEDREIQVVDGAILKACMMALIDGPETQELAGTIPEGTKVRGISIKNRVATVDLSGEFNQVNGDTDAIARLSIVNTLTKINGVDKVHFHVNGEDMTDSQGMPFGDISPVLLNADGTLMSGK